MAKKKAAAIVPWQAAMEKDAKVATDMVASSAGGQFISTKSGQLTMGGNPFPNNEMVVVILDSVRENVYYEGRYDPNNVQAPTCYAFNRKEEDLSPHEKVADPQNKTCKGCEHNEYGTSDTGKGKACGNVVRLALVSAGDVDPKSGEFTPYEAPAALENQAIAFMKVSVTSVKAFATYVTRIAGTLNRPPYGVYTKISVVPDDNNQHKILFEAAGQEPISNDLMDVVYARHQEAEAAIDFPYSVRDEEEKKPAKRKAKPARSKRY